MRITIWLVLIQYGNLCQPTSLNLTLELCLDCAGGLRCGDDAFGIVWGCLKTYVPWQIYELAPGCDVWTLPIGLCKCWV